MADKRNLIDKFAKQQGATTTETPSGADESFLKGTQATAPTAPGAVPGMPGVPTGPVAGQDNFLKGAENDPLDTWAYGEYLGDKVDMTQWSGSLLMGGSDTAFWMAVNPDARLGMSASEASKYLEEVYGGDVAPWLEASMIADPQDREEAFARLRALSSGQELIPGTHLEQRPAGRGGVQTVRVDDVTGEVVTSASSDWTQQIGSSSLTHRYAAMTAFLATRTDRWEDGKAVSSFDYDQVLTPEEQLQVAQATRAGAAGGAASLGDRALQVLTPFDSGGFNGSFVKVEQGANTYELNEEWAKAHPTRALAVTKMIQDYSPEAQVRIGGQGLVHPVFEMVGRPIDYVTSPITLAYKYASRGFGELGEALQFQGQGDREQFLKTADQLELDLANGVIPPDQVDDAIRDIERFRDWGTEGNIFNEGESISTDMHNAFLPEQAGMGLATMSAEGIGLYPGDPAYGPWVAGVGLIHNFSALDPLGWMGAVKNAKELTELYTVGKLTNASRKAASVNGLKTAITSGKTAASYLKGTTWVQFGTKLADATDDVNQARHAEALRQAKAFAQKKGYDVVEVTTENGPEIMVLGMSGEEGLNLARGFQQESFKTADGIVHSDRTVTPFDWANADEGVKFLDQGVEGIHLPQAFGEIKYNVPDANVRIKAAPPKVSQNWLVQRMFAKWAKTPDELMYGDNAINAAQDIYATVNRVRDMGMAEAKAVAARAGKVLSKEELYQAGAQRVLEVMAAWSPNYDPTLLRALADARNKADVHEILMAGMMGGIKDPLYYDKLMERMSKASEALGKIDTRLAEFDDLSRKLTDYAMSKGVNAALDENSARVLRQLYAEDADFKKLMDQWQKLQGEVKTLDHQRLDLIGERLSVRSMLDLDEITIPIRQIPPEKLVKQLNRMNPKDLTKTELFLKALANYPGQTTTKGLIQAAKGTANYEKRAKEIFFRFGHLKQAMTGGADIHMPIPGHGIPEGQLSDYITRSLTTIRDHAKLFGLSDRKVEELMGAYLRIQNREDWYMFIRKLYEDIADQSPLLNAEGRRTLRETHADLISERGGSFLQKQDQWGYWEREHTLSRDLVDPITGQKVKSGMPAFSGDMLNTIKLPSNEILMEHLSMVRRWQKALYAKGGAARIGAEAIMGMRDVVNASTYVWKSAVLMGRMPFALLSRIQGEQAWRMAALDYASEVNHPLEWLKSVLHKGDYSIFKDTHAEFLGTLTDNYNDVHSFGGSVKVFRRGNTTLQPGDGERFWNGVAVLFLRRFRSPEVRIMLSTTDVEKIIGEMTTDPIGKGVLDNIDSAYRQSLKPGEEFSEEALAQFRTEAIGRMKEELKLMTGDRADLYDVLKRGSHTEETPESVEMGRRIDARPTHSNDMEVNGAGFGFEDWASEPRLLDQLGKWARNDEGVDLAKLNVKRTKMKNGVIKLDDLDSGEVRYVVLDKEGNLLGYRSVDASGEGGVYVVPEARGQGVADKLFDGLAEDRNFQSLDDLNEYIDHQMFSPEGAASMKKQAKRYAIEKGWIPKDASLKVGTREFGQFLEAEYKAGRFTPPQFVSAKAAEYIVGDTRNLAGRFRDFMFQQFYSRPDVYISRGPMFRQAALREYNRLLDIGYDPKRAKLAAESYAAETVSAWMYDLASRTSAQYFLRNLMPFFPAWQELGGVWLRKLPTRAGGGGFEGWMMGSALYAHRAQALGDFFKATGLLYEDSTGELVFKVPGLDQAYRWLTGDQSAELRFRASGITGMLPVPGQESFLPGLGPAPASFLGLMARHNDTIYSLANHVLPYGNDVQVGPSSINHIFHAAGVTPPWELMTRDTQDLMMTLSVEDAMRSVSAEMPPAPRMEDFTNEAEYRAAAQAWSEELISRAEKRSSAHYLTRAFSAMMSPVSPTISSSYSREMTGIWKFVEGYREGTGNDDAASPLIEAFKAKYPNAVWYTNSKTINQGASRDFGDFDDFIKSWRDKQLRTLTPEQFTEWNLGMTQYWVMLGGNREATKGQSASELLLGGFQRKEVRSDNYAEWNMYLNTHPVFNELFDSWQQSLDKQESVSTTMAQQYIIDAKRQLESLDNLFTVNGIRDADYKKVLGKLSENIDYAASKTDDPVYQNVNWWWKNVGTPAYEEMSKLYDYAFSLPKPEQGPVFEQLRQLKNSWDTVTHGGEEMPSPEAVTWGNKSPEEQRKQLLDWAGSPIEWLSAFERGQVGYGGGDAVDELMTMINEKDHELAMWAAENYVSPSSSEYQARKTSNELELAQWASDNGVGEFWQLHQDPTYQRIIDTNLDNNNASFRYIASQADTYSAIVRSNGYEPGGSSELARKFQIDLFTKIDQARMADKSFDRLMSEMEAAYAAPGRDKSVGYEMYYKVFFAYYGPTPTISYTSPYSLNTGGTP